MSKPRLALIGLGLMGSGMARRLLKAKHEIVVYNRTLSKVQEIVTDGAVGTSSLEDFVSKLRAPRVVWLMLRGECFRIPIFDSSLGAPRSALKSILILDPARFQHIVQGNQLMGWRYIDYSRNSPLSSQVFLPEEVWHEKLPNPFDFWRGMSPLAVASTAATTDHINRLKQK